jgi:hypothetical protein
VRLSEESHYDGKVVEGKRAWSPRFWERLLEMAPEVNMEVPEPLPPNPYRDSVLDELAND